MGRLTGYSFVGWLVFGSLMSFGVWLDRFLVRGWDLVCGWIGFRVVDRCGLQMLARSVLAPGVFS